MPLDAIVTSPLQRCEQTARAIAAAHDEPPPVHTDEQLIEVGYGDWTGKPLRRLAKEPLWQVVQAHPSAVRFPGHHGEAMADMAHRAVAAVRDWNARLGPRAAYLVCSHGDVIKAILADSLGMHLDLCQRIQVDPCSVSIVRYTPLRPFVVRMNDIGGDIGGLARAIAGVKDRSARDLGEAAVGGGAGGAGGMAAGDSGGSGADGAQLAMDGAGGSGSGHAVVGHGTGG